MDNSEGHTYITGSTTILTEIGSEKYMYDTDGTF